MPVGRGVTTRAELRGRGLLADSSLWSARSQVEIVTASYDPDMNGIGSSPWVGDRSYLGIRVPTAATVDQRHRYWFRLAAAQIPSGKGAIVKGLRQLATIRSQGADSDPDGCSPVPVEREIVSPGWHFADGNISWHLRWESDHMGTSVPTFDADQVMGTTPNTDGMDCGLLYVPPAGIYVPPAAGIPRGRAVENLGTWHDMRFPWDKTSWDLHVPVIGPGKIVFYCSVHQTEPDTRCQIIPPAYGVWGLRPEDQFVIAYEGEQQAVRYGRVAGAMSLDLLPEVPPELVEVAK